MELISIDTEYENVNKFNKWRTSCYS